MKDPIRMCSHSLVKVITVLRSFSFSSFIYNAQRYCAKVLIHLDSLLTWTEAQKLSLRFGTQNDPKAVQSEDKSALV